MSIQTAIEEQTGRGTSTRLVTIADASRRLRRSVWTPKRLYADGDLPVTGIRNRWFIPESFIDQVFVSMRPGRAADFSEKDSMIPSAVSRGGHSRVPDWLAVTTLVRDGEGGVRHKRAATLSVGWGWCTGGQL